MRTEKFTSTVEFTVEIPDGTEPGAEISAIEELQDRYATELARYGQHGFRSVYGPTVRTDAIIHTRRQNARKA